MRPIMRTNYQNQLRIIGGKWRGRKISFPEIANIRPTPNRVRETLFNWLSPVIQDAHCLDLFAGSGSLGFEALSRGASSVTFVDNLKEVIDHLQKTIVLLGAQNAEVFSLEIPYSSLMAKKPFDIIFLDPPFGAYLISPCCQWLEEQQLLAENTYIYIEAEKALNPLPVPSNWQLIKSKVAGQVGYHLLLRTP